MSMFRLGIFALAAAISGLILAQAFSENAAEPTKKASVALMSGTAIDEADVAAWDKSIAPDGAGLPPGRGTVSAGREVFAVQCAACHGAEAVGGPAGSLVGGIGSLASDAPVKTVGSYWPYATTLFDYVRRAMPYFAPGSLSDEEVYSVTAYLLYLNEIIGEQTVLDAQTLPAVEMPNRDGFIAYWPTPEGAGRQE